MTKKDFEGLANELYRARAMATGNDTKDGVSLAASCIADLCEHGNPRFDRAYFMARVVQGPKIKKQREV